MRVLVLGAGVVGVASAWYLAEAGHEVVVVDRQAGAGLETSFANGGQISVSHAEPWANPGAPARILKWLGREDSPLLWRLRADPAQWAWGLRFLAECSAARTRANMAAIVRLALYSRARLQALRRETALEYDHLERGILHIYTNVVEFEQAAIQAALMREFGCERIVRSGTQCLKIEPALAGAALTVVGGTYTAADESGDACKFSQGLAALAAERGITCRYGVAVRAVIGEGSRVVGVLLEDGSRLTADAYVISLGSYTPLLMRPIGVRLPICPAKGYSITIPLDERSVAPTVSLTDDGCKLVFSRLGDRLRVAGTAEFAGYDTSINAVRCAAIERRALALFPGAGERRLIQRWSGLRPATPGNVPLVGRTRYANLFVNSGHGTLGWTMACGSGRLLADIVSGRTPDIDPQPYRPE